MTQLWRFSPEADLVRLLNWDTRFQNSELNQLCKMPSLKCFVSAVENKPNAVASLVLNPFSTERRYGDFTGLNLGVSQIILKF